MYQVYKRGGRIVDFDQEKIVTGITKAGCTLAESEIIMAKIQKWLPTVAVNDIVYSSDIRKKVITELQLLSPAVAANFESYKKI